MGYYISFAKWNSSQDWIQGGGGASDSYEKVINEMQLFFIANGKSFLALRGRKHLHPPLSNTLLSPAPSPLPHPPLSSFLHFISSFLHFHFPFLISSFLLLVLPGMAYMYLELISVSNYYLEPESIIFEPELCDN